MKPLTLALVGLFIVAVIAALGVRFTSVGDMFDRTEPVVVVHWTTGHLTRDGLLKDMAILNRTGRRPECLGDLRPS